LKPENVFIKLDKGEIKLADFGLATVNETGVSEQDKKNFWNQLKNPSANESSKRIVGTLAYISPEIYGGEKATAAIDIWAVGMIGYELIELRRPFEAEDKSLGRWRSLIKNTEPAPV
jgi:serine/threonine-protein kinase